MDAVMIGVAVVVAAVVCALVDAAIMVGGTGIEPVTSAV